MKRFIYSTIALTAACLAFSCAKNLEEAPITEEAAQRTVRTFTCTFAEPDTKLDLNTSTGKTTWEVGDQIMVHGGKDGATFEVVTLTAGDIFDDGRKAKISFSVGPYDRTPDVVSQYYAQYPASAVPTGSNMYYECRFNDTKNLLMAACNVDDSFVFFHLSAVIAYKVTGSFAKAVFSGNNGEAVAYDVYQARIRQDKGKDARCYYWKPGNGSGTPAPSTTYMSIPATDGTTVNYIYLTSGSGADGQYNVSYSGVNFTNGFTIKFLDGDDKEVKRVSTSTAKNIHAGELLDLGDITSHLYTYTPPATHDSSLTPPADGSEYDLSKTASANCYIVDGSNAAYANKIFKFKAYKGKGTTGVGKISSVEVLWQTWNNAETVTANSVIAAVDYDKQSANDYYEICFKMPSTLHAGNALIAAKDSGDKVLWSWHIWVPANTITAADYGIYTAGKAMHDRNLGALSVAVASNDSKIDVTSVGLVYQWGRKDPFPGPSSIETEGTYYSFATVAGTAPSAKTCQLSIEESILQPTTFAKGSNDWLSTSDGSLWGDNTSKTIYDPCPVGYRVPNRDKSNDNYLFAAKLNTATGWSFNKDNYWFTLGNPATVFPCAGYNDGGTSKATFRTVLWNAHHDGDHPDTAYNIYVYSGPAFANYAHGKSRGYYVRCVAE